MAHDLPLADVKILDFTWVMAGPAATRVLADYGATVVRIESTRRLDTGRTIGPFHDGQPGVEHSGFFQNLNASKLGLTLDLSQEAGREVARDLVRWADVVTESFSPNVMRAWGLDYAGLQQVQPDIIMLSRCSPISSCSAHVLWDIVDHSPGLPVLATWQRPSQAFLV